MLTVRRQLASPPFSLTLNLLCKWIGEVAHSFDRLTGSRVALRASHTLYRHYPWNYSRQCSLQPLDAGGVLGGGVRGLDGQ